MAKKKVTRSQRLKAKKLNREITRQELRSARGISKVFRKFSKDIDNTLKKTIKLKDIDFKTFTEDMAKVIALNGRRTVKVIAELSDDLFNTKLELEGLAAVRNKAIERYNTVAKRNIKKITQTTKDTISRIIKNGQKAGLNDNDIAKQIVESVENMSISRAKTIARTEVRNASNITSDETAKEGKLTKKTWLHTGGGFEDRPAHLALDGTTIKIDEQFDVNGFDADFPHDPSLPASEIISCHCLAIYV